LYALSGARFKIKVVLEAVKEPKKQSQIAQHYSLPPIQVSKWKRNFYRVCRKRFFKGCKISNGYDSNISRSLTNPSARRSRLWQRTIFLLIHFSINVDLGSYQRSN